MNPLHILANDADRVAAAVDMRPLDGKAVLVTGASGLIGLNLLAALMKSPARWIMGASRNGLPGFLRPYLDDPRFIEMRFDRPGNYPVPDYIVHGAGYAQPSRFTAEAMDTLRVNTQTTDRLLKSLAPGGRFLFLSSSEVYSGSKKVPHKESDIGTTDPSHPRSAYIEGKRCGEAIVNAWRAAGTDAMSARVCLAYGPGVKGDDTRALSEFIRQALAARRIELRDTGTALRAYCYIADVAEMLLNILLRGTMPVYNVGALHPTSIRVLAEFIGYMEGVPMTVGKGRGNAAAPVEARVDVTRYLEESGPKSFVTLDEGLRRTIDWHRAISE